VFSVKIRSPVHATGACVEDSEEIFCLFFLGDEEQTENFFGINLGLTTGVLECICCSD
jgi:hypothetical protein